MTMVCRAAVLCGLWAAGATFADPPEVTSVTLSQPPNTRLAVVTYEALGAGLATFQVRTGGVDVVHSEAVRTVTGAINRHVGAGSHSFTWDAGRDIPERIVSNLTVEVTLWATNAPPQYAAVNLVADGGGQFPVRFWGKESELPGGAAAVRWKKDWLLLRQIPSTLDATVTLGSPTYEAGREGASETQRTVRITAPFYMGVYPVTQYQWERVGTRINPSPSKWSSATRRDERPVEQVTWYDIRSSANGNAAVARTDWPNDGHSVGPGSFMHVLRAKTGDVLEFDLPTDAQWEYACRAGTDGAWNNGTSITNSTSDANLGLLGRYSRNGGQILNGTTWYDPDNMNALGSVLAVTTSNATAAVGSYLPNAWGLYDMHGNVYEWCLDWYVSGDALLLSGDDPRGPLSGTARMQRGGRWNDGASNCRSARRSSGSPSNRNSIVGFRVAAPAEVRIAP
jgi:formylglycine-generating enzyme required for sulfatase activity